MLNKKLVYSGSVKDIYNDEATGNYIFKFSDRYSIFDWGGMPDKLPNKGQALAFMADAFFKILNDKNSWQNLELPTNLKDSAAYKELCTKGLSHHGVGLVNEEGTKLDSDKLSDCFAVKPVDVFRPQAIEGAGGLYWDYSKYKRQLTNCLVPLEAIFRFGIPKGSSLMSRLSDTKYCKEIGVDSSAKEGCEFELPVIEFSTKLETLDRYISYSDARVMAGMSHEEFQNLIDLNKIVAIKLKEFFGENQIKLLDGKFEYSFGEINKSVRSFCMVDSIGPDELRLSYEGVQLSKENLRSFYRNSAWHDAISKAKQLADGRGLSDWKNICTNELKQIPKALSENVLTSNSQMYKTLANVVSKALYKKDIFPNSWSLDQIIKELN